MKIILLLVAFIFTVVCYAAPPPEVKAYELERTFVAVSDDCVCCHTQTATLEQGFTYSVLKEKEKIYAFESIKPISQSVQEVATCRKFSVPKANCGAATENAVMAINSANTDTKESYQSPPLLCTTNVAILNNTLIRNLKNSNYGYPLSAN